MDEEVVKGKEVGGEEEDEEAAEEQDELLLQGAEYQAYRQASSV